MDTSQELRNAENSIRDFVVEVLSRKYGGDIESHFGVSDVRIEKWKERKTIEEKRFSSTSIEERLIYYADFYDLKTIIKKNWGDCDELRDAFNNLKKIEFYLDELDKFRNPDAHRRDFLPHQEKLIAGICGELRSNIVNYRSNMETGDGYFPRIEFVRDNLGNSWKPGQGKNVNTKQTLRVGDVIEFLVTAIDPEDLPLKYYCSIDGVYREENKFSLEVSDKMIGRRTAISVGIQSPRDYRAVNGNQLDDWITFLFQVLPKE